MYEDSGRTRNICCIPFYGKIETNADPNSIGTEAQTSWQLANVGVKVRNKNETAKPFGNFYDLLAFRLVCRVKSATMYLRMRGTGTS